MPTRPPALTSWRSPAKKPATQPASGPRRSAQNTVIMKGRSGVAPATESIWTTLVCATLPPRVKRRSQRMLAVLPWLLGVALALDIVNLCLEAAILARLPR